MRNRDLYLSDVATADDLTTQIRTQRQFLSGNLMDSPLFHTFPQQGLHLFLQRRGSLERIFVGRAPAAVGRICSEAGVSLDSC